MWLRLSKDYLDSLWILSADRSIIQEGYPAYPSQAYDAAGAKPRGADTTLEIIYNKYT
jgi:hypothetical protein